MQNYRNLKKIKYFQRSIYLFFIVGVLSVGLITLNSCNSNTQVDPSISPATLAKSARPLDLPGLPNLHKVSDNLYRGAQPTAEGMKQLEKMGIKTVIDLRSLHSDREQLKGTALLYEHIGMTAFTPEDKDVIRFLQIVSDASRTPVFVHCKQGADRTGMMCAVYRVAIDGWSKDEAIEEMTKAGFSFHGIFTNLISYIRKLDIDRIKTQAGLSEHINVSNL